MSYSDFLLLRPSVPIRTTFEHKMLIERRLGYVMLTILWVVAVMISQGQLRAEEIQADEREPAASTLIGDIRFTVASGLAVESVATESLVKWPVVADWDYQGRLVVVESGGVESPIVEHNKQLLHRVVRLVDSDGDGKFDQRILAADQLPFTEGVLCLADSMLVSAPPQILKLTDEDGDGVCERREVWFDGKTITGCANDLHGPYLGRDGWIYWCKGAFAEQTHELLNGSSLQDEAAHMFRRHPDGGPLEPVMSGGMDNPIGVAATPAGERFFTSTFLQHPGNGRRDGIVHAIYGGVYGKDHQVINGLTRTGPLMPIMTQLGAAAPSGLLCLEKNTLREQLIETPESQVLVAALFNLQKVTAHQLVSNGASFKTNDIDLMTADRIDFHPTDVLEDADGSILVIDTGGWYDLCCPTSTVDQKTAPGGIYRLSAISGALKQSPERVDWADVTVADCAALLDDPRPWVARMALLKLQREGDASVPGLAKKMLDETAAIESRLRAEWALCSIGTTPALQHLTMILDSKHESLLSAACHAMALHRFVPAKSKLERLVHNDSAHIQRVAAEALGKIGDKNSVEPLMQALPINVDDPVLTHSLIYALIEIGDVDSLVKFLDSERTSQSRAAMIALDQLDAANRLSPTKILQSLTSRDKALGQTALDILRKHPQWAGTVAIQIDQLWLSRDATAEQFEMLISLIASWKDQPAIQQLVENWIVHRSASQVEYLSKAIAALGNSEVPRTWIGPLIDWLDESPAFVSPLLAGIDLTADHCEPILAAIRSHAAKSVGQQRIELVAALPLNSKIDASISDPIVDQFVTESDIERRSAKRALERLALSPLQAKKLVGGMNDLSALDLQFVISAVESAGSDELDSELLLAIRDLPPARALSAEAIQNVYRTRSDAIRRLADQTIEYLNQPDKDIQVALDERLANLVAGDPIRGLQVFRSNKASCSACHQMGYVGGNIGPELTQIGKSRTRRALLEAILYPSSRIEQGFQSTSILTLEGMVYSGVIRHYVNPNEFELQLNAEQSIMLRSEDIEVQKPSEISIMPAGMKDVLSEQDLADLIALLELAK